MKRPPQRAWPETIVEIPTSRPDSRADPQATQKISREELEEALRRTKSGTRRSVRSDPDLDGPRNDDAPQITIVKIDSVELETIDPSSLPAPASSSSAPPPESLATPPPVTSPITPSIAQVVPRTRAYDRVRGLPITPRTAFIAGIIVAVCVTLAAFLGFFAGRGVGPR